ncbi:hypothetical protein ACIA8M_38005 [Streptomyces anulatus]
MKKIIAVAVMALAAATVSLPAHADDHFAGPVDPANAWNFAAGVACPAETTAVDALGAAPGTSDIHDHDNSLCANSNG